MGGKSWGEIEDIARNKHLEVVWVPRDHQVQFLLDQYLDKEIDYLALVTKFRKNGWSIAGLFEVLQHMERERKKRGEDQKESW